jgi:aspartate/methionine/tyrosine aminotransferase
LAFCKNNSLHYISDEVYALSTHGTLRPTTEIFMLALGLGQSSDTIYVVYSLSKDFGSNGIRLVCSALLGLLSMLTRLGVIVKLKQTGTDVRSTEYA